MVHSQGFVDLPERLQVISDPHTGLNGIIAIHSTALGPAAGGCRFWSYANQEALVVDAIRLARGMSYKNALAGLPFGGGKAVLQLPEGEFDRTAIFRAFGDAVALLSGDYVTAEDVGTTVADMQAVRCQTGFVAGLESKDSSAGGDPSPWTALGVFESMKAAASEMLNMPIRGVSVAVQGVGNVGSGLSRLLAREGANLIVADADEARASHLAKELGATHVGADEILEVEAEIYAPCALGGILDNRSIPRLRAQLICGGANNQLATERDGDALRQRGIIYAPDYVVNAGGIINVAAEYLGESTFDVESRVLKIAPRLLSILRNAQARDLPSNAVADEMARRTIAGVRREAA